MQFSPKICNNADLHVILTNLAESDNNEIIELTQQGEAYIPSTIPKYGFVEFIKKVFHSMFFCKPKERRIGNITEFFIQFIKANKHEIANNPDNIHLIERLQAKFKLGNSAIKTVFADVLSKEISEIK